jgi:hypothetical protein
MPAPAIRGQTAPVSGGSTTSPAGTQVGDLVIVYTWERAGAGVPTHTVDTGNSYVEILTQGHDDGSLDGRLSVAYKVATASGANAYQAYTTDTGTPTWWTACTVLEAGTYSVATLPPSAGVDSTNTAAPNPPNLAGLDSAKNYLVIAVGAWHTASAVITVGAPTNYSNLIDISGSANGELAISSMAVTGATSEDPAVYTDNITPNGACAITLAVVEASASAAPIKQMHHYKTMAAA